MPVRTLPVRQAPTTPQHPWPLTTKAPRKPWRRGEPATPIDRYLQVGLNALGFTGKNGLPLVEDGLPGPQTFAAVAKCQYAAGIVDEVGIVGKWTWMVIDRALYDGWTPAPETMSSPRVVKDRQGNVLYRDPEPRTTAIYLGHNRYTGVPVDKYGICEEAQFASDAARLAHPSWPDNFPAVDRKTSTGGVSRHREACARDWKVDLDRDGNWKEPAEVAKVNALTDYMAARMAGPMQTQRIYARGDYANGINDTTRPLTSRLARFSGEDRLEQIVWNGYTLQWRYFGSGRTHDDRGRPVIARTGDYYLGWWKLKPTSDQHRDHAHTQWTPIIGGILLSDADMRAAA